MSPVVSRTSSGAPWHFTSVGGYPILYLTGRDDVLCPSCAAAAEDDPDTDPKDRPTVGDVHWEGDPIDCDGCGKPIESAYGPVV